MEIEEISNRQKQILSLLEINCELNVKDISDKIVVAEATVRRDLTKLSELNYIKKSYGKISLVNPTERRIKGNTKNLDEEDLLLVNTTANQIHNGNVVLITNGKMNCQIVDNLLINDKYITIVTNSLDVFDRSKDSVTLNNILLAGLYNRESRTFSGTTTYSILSTLRADCFIIHPSGIDFSMGFLAEPTEDLPLIQNMINVARKVILYIDEKCITKTSGLFVAPFTIVSSIVITRKVYNKYLNDLKLFDFDIIIAE